jgi:hypothetical protein
VECFDFTDGIAFEKRPKVRKFECATGERSRELGERVKRYVVDGDTQRIANVLGQVSVKESGGR